MMSANAMNSIAKFGLNSLENKYNFIRNTKKVLQDQLAISVSSVIVIMVTNTYEISYIVYKSKYNAITCIYYSYGMSIFITFTYNLFKM